MNGEADDDEMVKKYWDLNPNNESAVKSIVRSRLLPEYNNRSLLFRDKIKMALSYALSSGKNLGGEFDSNLLPFDHPDDPNLFYKWIWEVFFPDENFELSNIDDFEEVEDLNEPLSIAYGQRNSSR